MMTLSQASARAVSVPGLSLQPDVRHVRRLGLAGINDDDLEIALLLLPEKPRPAAHVRFRRIGAPVHHALGIGHLDGIGGDIAHDRHVDGHVVDAADDAGSEDVVRIAEEAGEAASGPVVIAPVGALEESQRLSAVPVLELQQLLTDLAEGLIPGDPLPLALPALRPVLFSGYISWPGW